MITVRDLTPDELDVAVDVRTRSFGPLDAGDRPYWDAMMLRAIAERRVLAAYDGPELVAMARALAFTQWFGGRGVPMAGIAGVVVAPHARSRGVATTVLRDLVQRCVELGDVVSGLYPATVVPYRRLGWEDAGVRQRVSVDSHLLRSLATRGGPAVRVARPGDAEAVLALIDDVHARSRANGPMSWDLAELREELEDPDTFSYLADGGFVSYGWQGDDLVVQALFTTDPDVARALWAVVGSGSSVARTVHAWVAPHDPVHQLVAEQVARTATVERWMLRVLDAPAAVAGRGFAPVVAGSAELVVDDPYVPGAGGSWRLEVAGGAGALHPVEPADAALRLGPGGLACLYAGTQVRTLRAAGLAHGGTPAGDDLLDAALAGSPTYMLEHF
ncbi:MAG TPA: GNAT family N-acetyltransferase [Actinomycetales bacterium]